jgi:hypothetical protein
MKAFGYFWPGITIIITFLALANTGCGDSAPTPPSLPPSFLPVEFTVSVTGTISLKATDPYTATLIAQIASTKPYTVPAKQDELIVIINDSRHQASHSIYSVHSGIGEFVAILNREEQVSIRNRIATIDIGSGKISTIDFARIDGPVDVPTPEAWAIATRTAIALDPTIPHKIGETWEHDGLSLNLVAVEVRTGDEGGDAAVRCWFRMLNMTSARKRITYNFSAIRLYDGIGNEYIDRSDSNQGSLWLDHLKQWNFDREYSFRAKEQNRVPDAQYIDIRVESFAHIDKAYWRYDLNPPGHAIDLGTSGAKTLGEYFEHDGLEITAGRIDERNQEDKNEAFSVAYSVLNRSVQRQQLALNTEHLYALDDRGNRYSDWDGGFIVQGIDPGKSFEFTRTYSQMAGLHSRIPILAKYLLVQLDCLQGSGCPNWQKVLSR